MACTSASCMPAAAPLAPPTGGTGTSTWDQLCLYMQAYRWMVDSRVCVCVCMCVCVCVSVHAYMHVCVRDHLHVQLSLSLSLCTGPVRQGAS